MAQFAGLGNHGGALAAPVRAHLAARRARLERAAGHLDSAAVLDLLGQIDSALERLDAGSWGYCDRCAETVEAERLLHDPLVRVCLGCLSDREQRALERDLELAASIQAALLPARRVRQDGWEVAYRYLPLGAVSGDHCDVWFPNGEGGAAHFALGDVAGKGVAAALLMSHLKATLRTLGGMQLPLPSMVERANHLLCESTAARSYATLVVGRLGDAGAVELCNAGHCPPVLVRRGATETIAATGLPLGLLAEAGFEARRFTLAPGETLLVYTDGLSETTGEDGDELGAAGVCETVGRLGERDLDELLDGCIDRAERLRGREPRTDDVTLMAVRRVV